MTKWVSTTGRKRNEPKVDALPEFLAYKDDGCEVAPACLRCPLPKCKYDDIDMYWAEKREKRNRQILMAVGHGGPLLDGEATRIAGEFGLNKRTVFRVVAAAKLLPLKPGSPTH